MGQQLSRGAASDAIKKAAATRNIALNAKDLRTILDSCGTFPVSPEVLQKAIAQHMPLLTAALSKNDEKAFADLDALRGRTLLTLSYFSEPQQSNEAMAKLGQDVWAIILKDFSADAVAQLARVSKLFHRVTSSDAVWRPIFFRVFGPSAKLHSTWKAAFITAAMLVKEEERQSEVYGIALRAWNEECEAFRRKHPPKLAKPRISPHVACGMRPYRPPHAVGPPVSVLRRNDSNTNLLPIPSHCGFSKHPNEKPIPQETFSIDFESAMKEYLVFTDMVYGSRAKVSIFSCPTLQEETITKIEANADVVLGRYTSFLKLKRENPTTLLIPTLEIELAWICHMLRPDLYAKDLRALGFSELLDHRLTLNLYESNMRKAALKNTQKLWKEKFGVPYLEEEKKGLGIFSKKEESESLEESRAVWDANFVAPEYIDAPTPQVAPSSLRKGYEDVPLPPTLVEKKPKPALKLQREMAFSHHVSLVPCGKNETSLQPCEIVKDGKWPVELQNHGVPSSMSILKGYECFLFLYSSCAGTPEIANFHPSYSVDIAWHTHMIHPLQYVADVKRLVGFPLVHDPWPGTEEDRMTNGEKSQMLWDQHFKPIEDLGDLPTVVPPPTGARVEDQLRRRFQNRRVKF